MHSNKKPSKAKGKKKKDEKLKGERPDAEFRYPARFRDGFDLKSVKTTCFLQFVSSLSYEDKLMRSTHTPISHTYVLDILRPIIFSHSSSVPTSKMERWISMAPSSSPLFWCSCSVCVVLVFDISPGRLGVKVYQMAGAKRNSKDNSKDIRLPMLKRWRDDGGVMIIGSDMFRNLTNANYKKKTFSS
jgi:hypothetical protein